MMVKEKTLTSPEFGIHQLSSAIGEKKSHIAEAEKSICFRKSKNMQDRVAKQKAELAEMEMVLKALRENMGLPSFKTGGLSGAQRRKRKRLKLLNNALARH